MKKISIAGMVLMLAGLSQATLIYSNNFNGIELKAAGITTLMVGVQTNNGVVESTTGVSGSSFGVDLTSVNMTGVTAIKITADVFMSTNGSHAMGFGNESTDSNMIVDGNGQVAFQTLNKKYTVYGGVGLSNAFTSGANQYTTGAVSKVEFTYYTDNKVDVVINGVAKLTGYQLVPTVAPTLDYVFFNTRLQAPAALGGATFDNVMIETIPEPATIGMVGLGALVVLIIRKKMVK